MFYIFANFWISFLLRNPRVRYKRIIPAGSAKIKLRVNPAIRYETADTPITVMA